MHPHVPCAALPRTVTPPHPSRRAITGGKHGCTRVFSSRRSSTRTHASHGRAACDLWAVSRLLWMFLTQPVQGAACDQGSDQCRWLRDGTVRRCHVLRHSYLPTLIQNRTTRPCQPTTARLLAHRWSACQCNINTTSTRASFQCCRRRSSISTATDFRTGCLVSSLRADFGCVSSSSSRGGSGHRSKVTTITATDHRTDRAWLCAHRHPIWRSRTLVVRRCCGGDGGGGQRCRGAMRG